MNNCTIDSISTNDILTVIDYQCLPVIDLGLPILWEKLFKESHPRMYELVREDVRNRVEECVKNER